MWYPEKNSSRSRRCRATGANKTAMSRNSTPMMSNSNVFRCGARSLDSRQGDREPGPVPQRDPPRATGGNRATSRRERRRERRRKKRREKKTEEKQNLRRKLNILQWNAEGVFKKKLELVERMNKENIDIACIQETHLNPAHRFQVRGYECFRSDRIERHKGGVLILVRNSINAEQLICVSLIFCEIMLSNNVGD